MTTTVCGSCGRDVSIDAPFCRYCGKPMGTKEEERPPTIVPANGVQSTPFRSKPGRKSGKLLDRIVFGAFRLGKVIAVVLTMVFFLVFLLSVVALGLTSMSKFEVPTFTDAHTNRTSATGDVKTDTSGIKERQELERQYGDRLRKILENYSLAANGYDMLVAWMIDVPKGHRDASVTGMERFMADGVAFAKQNNKQPDTPQLIGNYLRLFKSSLDAESASRAEAQQTRLQILAVLGGSALLFFVFLIIPALLQIEKNTRTAVVA